MKKILYTIGILMFMALVVKPIAAMGADPNPPFSGSDLEVPFSTARISSKIVNAAADSDTAAATDWTQVFGDDDETEIGQDLYATIYDKTQNQPQQQAFKNVAAKYGMTEAEMVKIIYGNYSKMLEEKPGMTQADAYNKMAEIQQEFAEEKDILQVEADIKAAVEPNEMFANDDLNDSGFDLINDLQIIENLLFLKSQPISVGGGWWPSLGDSEDTPAEDGAPPGSPTAGGPPSGSGEISGGAGGAADDSVTTAESAAGSGQVLTEGSTAVPKTGTAAAVTEDKVNPNDCLETNNYEKALNEFEEKKATDNNLKDNSAGQIPSNKAGTASGTTPQGDAAASSANPSAAGGPGKFRSTTDFMQPVQQNAPPAEAAPAADWLKPKECDQVFCLFVDFVMAPVTTSFQDIDNCVACHAEKINDILKKTIEHTLVPGKAPGNLGESAKCKNAMAAGFDSINMNIYAQPIPVKTPANDDLIYGKSIADEWLDFCNTMSFPFTCSKTDPPATPADSNFEIPESAADTTAKKAVAQATEETSFSKIAKDIDIASKQIEKEKAKGLQVYATSLGTDSAINFYNPLKFELDQMNSYFDNIRFILTSLHTEVATMPGPQACTDLRNRKTCD